MSCQSQVAASVCAGAGVHAQGAASREGVDQGGKAAQRPCRTIALNRERRCCSEIVYLSKHRQMVD